MFIYLVKSRVFMHLWATDFWVFITGWRTPSQHFYRLSPSVIMSNQNYWVFIRGGIYPFLLCPTHVFFMLCNHETHFGRYPIIELTTHSPRMMNDHNHAHTPNTMRCPHAYAMQKCNACTSCYMYKEHYMKHLHSIVYTISIMDNYIKRT